jgi:hypothetical protein
VEDKAMDQLSQLDRGRINILESSGEIVAVVSVDPHARLKHEKDR